MKKSKSQKPEEKIENNAETEQLKGQLARALADYDNLSRRVETERSEIKKIISIRLILSLLSVLDNLESAQAHLKDQGLAISILQFKKVLSEEGLTEVLPAVGSAFDENTMEAVEVVEGKEDNMVASVSLIGYKFSDGSVVRHAKVVVTKK